MWDGYDYKDFEFEGRKATVVFPKTADNLRNWTLKTEYQYAFVEEEMALLERGFHVAYLENNNRFATKEDCDAKARFAEFLHAKYNLRDKCVLVGMSLGGAHAVNFAGFYPEKVVCMFIDAPVLNFLNYPGKPQCKSVWENEFVKAYPGITRAGLLNFENHPMNKIPVLKEHKIPIIMLYGDEDKTVDYSENGRLMEYEYEDMPELLTVIKRECQGHHPHGFPQKPEIVADFIEEHSK